MVIRIRVRVGLRLVEAESYPATLGLTRRLFNTKNFAESVALAEVCGLLSTILVVIGNVLNKVTSLHRKLGHRTVQLSLGTGD